MRDNIEVKCVGINSCFAFKAIPENLSFLLPIYTATFSMNSNKTKKSTLYFAWYFEFDLFSRVKDENREDELRRCEARQEILFSR